MTFLSYLISGISLGSIYAIIALGYTMVYGIAKMLNFAHGDVIMVGAYVCFFAMNSFGLPPLVGVLLAMLVCTILGVVIERLAYKPLRQATSLAVLITAIGVSYLLQHLALIFWKSNPRTFHSIVGDGTLPVGGLTIPYVTIVAIAACLVIMVGLTLFSNMVHPIPNYFHPFFLALIGSLVVTIILSKLYPPKAPELDYQTKLLVVPAKERKLADYKRDIKYGYGLIVAGLAITTFLTVVWVLPVGQMLGG